MEKFDIMVSVKLRLLLLLLKYIQISPAGGARGLKWYVPKLM